MERLAGDKLIFVPSHRRLPHVGAKVALGPGRTGGGRGRRHPRPNRRRGRLPCGCHRRPARAARFARSLSTAEGLAWGRVQAWIAQAALPEEVVGNRFDWARPVVRPALIAILGPESSGWHTESRPRPDRPGSSQTWIHRTKPADPVNQPTPPEHYHDQEPG